MFYIMKLFWCILAFHSDMTDFADSWLIKLMNIHLILCIFNIFPKLLQLMKEVTYQVTETHQKVRG